MSERNKSLIYFALIFAALFTFYYIFILEILPLAFGASYNLMQTIFTLSVVISTLLLSTIRFTGRKKPLAVFFLIVPIMILLILLFNSYTVNIFATITIGICLGIAQLTFLAYFWESVLSNQRGKSAALIVFISLLIYSIIGIMITFEIEFTTIAIYLSVMLPIALIAVLRLSNKAINKSENFPEKRTIVLYAIPWIIFSLINATLSRSIALNIQQSLQSHLLFTSSALQIIGALVGALSCGIIIDYLGRRPTLAISITLYGISMVFSGLLSIPINEMLLFSAFLIDGISWGIILTTYVFIIWGDLANTKNCLAMYSIGLIVFFGTAGIGYLPITIDLLTVNERILIGCSLIFLCNIPIALAPELLPPETREKSQMKGYLKKVRKVAKDLES